VEALIQRLLGRRKRILINPLQYRLVLIALVHFAIIVGVFAALMFLPAALHLRSASLDSSPENLAAANEFLTLHARFWPAVILLLGLLVLHTLIVSHRLVGPLYRFRRVWQAVAEGNLSVRATLRRHDYLTQEAEAINAMIEALAGRVAGLDEQVTALRAVLADLERVRTGGCANGLDDTVRDLGALVDRLGARLVDFRGDGGLENPRLAPPSGDPRP
jgi:methyl-accepting chemotaxis protein